MRASVAGSSSSSLRDAPTARAPPKSSSERGRTFRARQRQREAALARAVAQLRDQVQALRRSRLLQLEALTRRRHAAEGPHARTIREFFTLCQDGLARAARTAHGAHQIQFKESYMRYVYAPDAVIGDARGVDEAIHQWRLYTEFHDRFHVAMDHIEVVGSEENPTFHLHATLTVRVSRQTFEHVFPHALASEGIVQKFLHREVEYGCVVWFHFDDDGRIDYYCANVDFIEGLRRAGGTVEEVAAMLEHARITPECTLRDKATSSDGDGDRDCAAAG